MTADTGTLERTDTGTHAVVRVIDPGVHESAPYSRAVGHLDRWVQAEREAVDAFAAWLEGQTAQAAAEMRQLADELHLPPVWAEVEPAPALPVKSGWVPRSPERVLQEAYERTRPAIEDFAPAPDETMPGREATPQPMPVAQLVVTRRVTDEQAAEIKRRWREMTGKNVEIERGPRNPVARRVDGWLASFEAWWRRKQAQRDQRMGV